MRETTCDVLIAGGSMGGCAAALAAASMGRNVVLTEETDWLGGQLTSQAVSCPDENRYIESFGCTRTYRALRNGIRDFYRRNYPLKPEVRANPIFDPGNGWVSHICQEPRVGEAVINEMLAAQLAAGRIRLFPRHKPVSADVDGDVVKAVTFRDLDSRRELTVHAPFVLDATELGEILPLTGTEYVSGAESRSDSGEEHAVDGDAQPENVQSFTVCFLLDYRDGEDHTISRPRNYASYRDNQPFSWVQLHPHTNEPRQLCMWDHGKGWDHGVPMWTYRRVLDKEQFAPGFFPSDVSLINWPMNDYTLGNIIDKPEEEVRKHIRAAKDLSLSLLYWLQTEAPRPDGGAGWPGLRLRGDLVGTTDGMAKYPYIRESRRILPVFRVLEQHISPNTSDSPLADHFDDSVGIGLYRIDLHPAAGGYAYIDSGCRPYQIPMGALIPQRMRNLLAACKNIGTTHITNGAYRLHPVEWNIGEAAGALAVFCMDRGVDPQTARADEKLLREFQTWLVEMGVPLEWPRMYPA